MIASDLLCKVHCVEVPGLARWIWEAAVWLPLPSSPAKANWHFRLCCPQVDRVAGAVRETFQTSSGECLHSAIRVVRN